MKPAWDWTPAIQDVSRPFRSGGHRQADACSPCRRAIWAYGKSDALFLHLKALPDVLEELLGAGSPGEIRAAGASTQPRRAEESYMPCFLAGETLGRGIALSMGIPFFSFSQQEGHLAAAAWSSDMRNCWTGRFSPGTCRRHHGTSLCDAPEAAVAAERIGGTERPGGRPAHRQDGKTPGIAVFPQAGAGRFGRSS
jgi:N6-L-threonylcarbamoyladenine synthase